MIEERSGLWWPKGDRVCEELLLKEVNGLDKALAYCTRTDTVIQAGGNVGVYPRYLAEHFDHVWTFEPDLVNLECLKRNTANLNNVYTMPMGLGFLYDNVGLKRYPENCGAAHVVSGQDVRLIPLDALNLLNIDLIQLDVEGFEQRVLKGAALTITRDKPVIMVENCGHGDRYGCHHLPEWISQTFDYRVAEQVDNDVVMIPV